MKLLGRPAAVQELQAVQRLQFDMRTIYNPTGPGDPGHIKTVGVKFFSVVSAWPINPLVSQAAKLFTENGSMVPMVGQMLNLPLNGSSWLRLVSLPDAFGSVLPAACYLVDIVLHNEPLTNVQAVRTFAQEYDFLLDAPPFDAKYFGFGPAIVLGPPGPTVQSVTGFAPYRRLTLLWNENPGGSGCICNVDRETIIGPVPLVIQSVPVNTLTTVLLPYDSYCIGFSNPGGGAVQLRLLLELSHPTTV